MTQFGGQSTTDEVLKGVNLVGKRVLLTGVSAGLGTETARALIAHGADVVGTARNISKAEKATTSMIQAEGQAGRLDLIELDLASLASVRACADALNDAGSPFDVVIANAGVMACPFKKTEDGFEMQFGTNHIGHFVLVNRIASLIKPGGRVVSLSSLAHHFSDVDLDDPNYEYMPYVEFEAYGRSKTANALFVVEFDRRHKSTGKRAVAVHPGSIQTELVRHLTPEIMRQIQPDQSSRESKEEPRSLMKSVPQGAATTVWSGFVANADEIGGKYCEDCQVAEIVDNPKARHGVAPYALDHERARLLWAKTEEMVGEQF